MSQHVCEREGERERERKRVQVHIELLSNPLMMVCGLCLCLCLCLCVCLSVNIQLHAELPSNPLIWWCMCVCACACVCLCVYEYTGTHWVAFQPSHDGVWSACIGRDCKGPRGYSHRLCAILLREHRTLLTKDRALLREHCSTGENRALHRQHRCVLLRCCVQLFLRATLLREGRTLSREFVL